MIKCLKNSNYTGKVSPLFSTSCAEEVYNFHKKIACYSPTPLISLPNLSKRLGVKNIFVKDESKRFNLNAFKVLGGSYALGKLLSNQLNLPCDNVDFHQISGIKSTVFVTATAGNHGIGVAWAARELGQKAVVYLPKGSSQVIVNRLQELSAECIVSDFNYDDTVKLADRVANENGWILVQDTAWEGYEKIPTWISQGYMTMAKEAIEQMREKPTHVFLQAGVGSMAGGVLGYLVNELGVNSFKTIIVEPSVADCLYQSSLVDKVYKVKGELNSIMAGLSCGVPSLVTWPTLKGAAHSFFSVPDSITENGMRILAMPEGNDEKIISGPSGAVTMGLLFDILVNKTIPIESLELDEDSVILLFNTEGDTNPELYKEIVQQNYDIL